MGGFSDSKARAEASKNEADLRLANDDVRNAVSSGVVRVGKVIRAGVGTYDFRVATGTGAYYVCSVVSKTSCAPFGYSESVLPLEGSNVLFVPSSDATGTGYILGVIPGSPADNSGKDDGISQINVPRQGYTLPYGPGKDTEAAYSVPQADENGNCGFFGGYRPMDVFPGEYVLMNEHGVGIDGDMLTMAIRGGHASLAASRIDDTARIVCRNFRFYGSRGSTILFTDAGCTTEETTFAPYIGERTGGSGIERWMDPIQDDTEDKTKKPESEEDKEPPVIKTRIRSFLGYLGGLLSVFISKPEKNTEKAEDARRSDDKEPKDNGLMQLNVNDNGRVMFRSAGGFVLERSDRIPVPVRINEYDSPGGVKAEDIEKEDILKFEMPEDDEGNQSPHYMQLALNDKLAYDYRKTYDRFIEHIPSFGSDEGESSGGDGSSGAEGEETGGDDFYLRNEQDLDQIENDAGIPDRKIAPDDLEDAAGRRAGIYVLPSGEVSIRDAWGSEILMTGGNIVINTPGSVKANPGYSLIVQAGDDIVLKARHSIDIDATENDITIKGDRNVRIASGSDDTTDAGGIILESLSAADTLTIPDGENNEGEDAVSTGIVLKATNSHVSMLGHRTIIGGLEEVRVATGTEKDTRSGQFNVATGQVGIAASDGVMASCGEAGLVVTENAVAVVGGSVVLSGRDGVMFAKTGQIGVPIWVDFESDFVSSYSNRLDEYLKNASKDALNSPLVFEDLQDSVLFTYRTSEQCHTAAGMELTDTPEVFTEYQPYWSVLAKMKVGTLKDMELEEWEMHTINGEYPWPGTDAIENGKYAMLDDTQATEDETYNTMKLTVKIKSKDENGNDTEEDMDIACSKDYDEIEGDEESENKMLVKLEKISKFIVPVVSDQEDAEESGENT